jgi:outer membrane protein TolC
MFKLNDKRFFIILLLCLLALPGLARAEEVLTWEDCVTEALKNHPDLIAAEEKVKQAKSDKGIALSGILPQFSSQLSGSTSQSASGSTTDAYAYAVTGQQLIFDGFKTIDDIKSASKTLTAQEYDYLVISSDIRLNLRVAFATLLRAQELIAITEDIASRRQQNLELVQLRYEAGREHKGALLTAQADLAQAQFEVAQAKRNLSLVQRELTKELGREKKLTFEVKGVFEIEEVDYAEKPDFEFLAVSTPFLKELIAKKEAARLDYSSAKADFFPQIYVSGSFGKTHTKWPPQDDQWSAGVTVSLPIFEGGSRIAQLSKSKSLLKQAQADERSGRDSVLVTLEETWKNFQDAIDTVLVKEKFLEAAQERAKIASAQYSQGLIAFDDWVIIEDNLVNAKKNYLDAQASLLTAEADWVQAKGGTLEYAQK